MIKAVLTTCLLCCFSFALAQTSMYRWTGWTCTAEWDEYCETTQNFELPEGLDYCGHSIEVNSINHANVRLTGVSQRGISVYARADGTGNPFNRERGWWEVNIAVRGINSSTSSSQRQQICSSGMAEYMPPNTDLTAEQNYLVQPGHYTYSSLPSCQGVIEKGTANCVDFHIEIPATAAIIRVDAFSKEYNAPAWIQIQPNSGLAWSKFRGNYEVRIEDNLQIVRWTFMNWSHNLTREAKVVVTYQLPQ